MLCHLVHDALRGYPVSVDAFVIIGSQENSLCLWISDFHLSAQLLESAENFQIEPALNPCFEVCVFKHLVDKNFDIGQSLTKCH